MENKKALRPTFIGFVLLLLALLITGIFGISDLMNGGYGTLHGHQFAYGLKASIGYFFLLWRPSQFMHETAFIGLVIVLVAITSTLTMIIMSLKQKKPFFIIPSLLFGASLSYLAFILILCIPMAQLGVMRVFPQLFMGGVTGLTLFSIYFEFLALKKIFTESMKLFEKASGLEEEEEEQQPQQPQYVQPAPVYAGLTEQQVREIVEKYLQEHVDELHPNGAVVAEEPKEEEPAPVEEEPAPAPVEEEPVEEEEPEEEELDEEEAEEEGEEQPVDNAPVGLSIRGKRRRASFETRLKNSEFDLRHKYYDLRDYIKWYGLRNRISIPGSTFSYKRQRYVFVTIVGKHIRVYLNLDPNDYADSTIPVEPALAKKYEDLPCLLRVKSDLSYRRAKKLVDDLMQKIGIDKPDEDEPKETQKDE